MPGKNIMNNLRFVLVLGVFLVHHELGKRLINGMEYITLLQPPHKELSLETYNHIPRLLKASILKSETKKREENLRNQSNCSLNKSDILRSVFEKIPVYWQDNISTQEFMNLISVAWLMNESKYNPEDFLDSEVKNFLSDPYKKNIPILNNEYYSRLYRLYKSFKPEDLNRLTPSILRRTITRNFIQNRVELNPTDVTDTQLAYFLGNRLEIPEQMRPDKFVALLHMYKTMSNTANGPIIDTASLRKFIFNSWLEREDFLNPDDVTDNDLKMFLDDPNRTKQKQVTALVSSVKYKILLRLYNGIAKESRKALSTKEFQLYLNLAYLLKNKNLNPANVTQEEIAKFLSAPYEENISKTIKTNPSKINTSQYKLSNHNMLVEIVIKLPQYMKTNITFEKVRDLLYTGWLMYGNAINPENVSDDQIRIFLSDPYREQVDNTQSEKFKLLSEMFNCLSHEEKMSINESTFRLHILYAYEHSKSNITPNTHTDKELEIFLANPYKKNDISEDVYSSLFLMYNGSSNQENTSVEIIRHKIIVSWAMKDIYLNPSNVSDDEIEKYIKCPITQQDVEAKTEKYMSLYSIYMRLSDTTKNMLTASSFRKTIFISWMTTKSKMNPNEVSDDDLDKFLVDIKKVPEESINPKHIYSTLYNLYNQLCKNIKISELTASKFRRMIFVGWITNQNMIHPNLLSDRKLENFLRNIQNKKNKVDNFEDDDINSFIDEFETVKVTN